MEKARPILETLAQQDGINIAMVISRDGFIVEIQTARDLHSEADTIAATVSTMWEKTNSVGRELSVETAVNSLIEFDSALISTSLIKPDDLLLTVVGDKHINPATMRYLTSKFSELLTRSL